MSKLRRNYTYTVGDVVNALPNYTLTCTKAGTTSANPITVQEGTIIDGTCEWNCVNNRGGAVEDWEAGKTYNVNQLVKSDSKLYICMNEHTSSSAFATDLLAGNWAFIGGAGYSNVIMDTIYEGDVQVSATTGSSSYTLASSSDNYDYAICTVKITQTSGILVKATVVVPTNTSNAISWSYGVGSGNVDIAVYGWVSLSDSKTSIRFALRARGSAVASVSLERVDGIKVNTMTLSEIAGLSMPSDVYETIEHKYTNSSTSWETTKFVAPADGYLFTRINARQGGFVNLNTMYAGSQFGCNTSNADASMRFLYGQLPLKKGQTGFVRILNCYSSPDDCVRFYYTVGSAKELGLV